MDNVAFRNQDGSVAMVLINRNNTATTVCIAYGGETFPETMPAGSAMTFCWQGYNPGVLSNRQGVRTMNDIELKDQICDVCHKMWQLGWVAANDGNVSVKLEDGTFFATPTGISKSFITPEKLVRINDKGEVLEGLDGYRPSSEIKMHLRCYRERTDVGVVVHAHPPTATGFAVAHLDMDRYNMIETVLTLGSVPVTPYGTPSTYEVPEAIAPYLQEHDALLLRNHGALTVGCDLITAYYRMETLELNAKISLVAHLLGGERKISRENIDHLCSMRGGYGITGRHYRKEK